MNRHTGKPVSRFALHCHCRSLCKFLYLHFRSLLDDRLCEASCINTWLAFACFRVTTARDSGLKFYFCFSEVVVPFSDGSLSFCVCVLRRREFSSSRQSRTGLAQCPNRERFPFPRPGQTPRPRFDDGCRLGALRVP